MEDRVRKLQSADRQLAMAVLTAAFIGDPVNRWMFPDPRTYLNLFEVFSDAFCGAAIELGHGYIADECRGVALWLPPGVSSDAEVMVELVVANCSENVLSDIPAFMEQMEKMHPVDENCWYLAMIGVDVAYQGRGVGAALLKESLRFVDEKGGTAYLEASTKQSAALYERHGFEFTGAIQAGNSPEVYPMFRTAR
jgi:ribosomal protein S18 acetylase RimI-like enzyme